MNKSRLGCMKNAIDEMAKEPYVDKDRLDA